MEMAIYYTEATVPTVEAQMAAYYAQDRGQLEGLKLGLGTVPMPRTDMQPALAEALAVELDKPVSTERFAKILGGQNADGGDLPGQKRELSYIDLTWQAPRSVSVAWAFAPEAERNSILHCHRIATAEAMAYMEREIAKVGFGDGHANGMERGHFAWFNCEHFTARPTLAVAQVDAITGRVDTTLHTVPGHHIAGDPHVHTHTIMPNLMHTESGRWVSFDLDKLKDRIHEFGGVYQAILARELRKCGFDACLDERTLMAKMPAVPEHVVEAFSKRTRQAEQVAKEQAVKEGLDWEAMDGAAQVKFLHDGAMRTRLHKAELSDVFAWREQARVLNYDPQSFYMVGPSRAPMTDVERLACTMDAALPLFSDVLVKRAVVSGGDARLTAVRGLIDWGIKDTRDIDTVTRAMVRDGVLQDGQQTDLLWRVDKRGRVKITTELHKGQEEELIALARSASADKATALSASAIDAAITRSGIDFGGDHGAAQAAAVRSLGMAGGLGVMIGAAGTGKTKAVLPPLVDAWQEAGYEVWGTALAWRQAGDMAEAGISRRNCRAMQPFLDAISVGAIEITGRSVIVLDELGQIGTRQLLELLRIRDSTGAKIVAMGDDRQCQSIEAGPVIELLTKALGEDAIPQIHTTIRQRSAEELRVVSLFREGAVQDAVDIKRASGTAELVDGGYRAVITRIAALYMERRAAHPEFSVTVSAPTNADAREISRAIRGIRRDIREIGEDRKIVLASDGRGETFSMPLAAGDNLRLFKRTRGTFFTDAGRRKSVIVGDNGSIVRVLEVDPSRGISARLPSGKTAFVAWSEMKHRNSDALAITYGDCGTIDSSQGITSDEHIHAFPSGSQAVQGFKNYVGQTRHRVRSYMIGSMGAELKSAAMTRPLGLPEPKGQEAHDVAWQQVVKNFSRMPLKESALAMLASLDDVRKRATAALQGGLRQQEQVQRAGARTGFSARVKQSKVAKVVRQVLDHVEKHADTRRETMTKIQTEIERATPVVRKRMKISEGDAQHQLAAFLRANGLRIEGMPVLDGQRHYVGLEGSKERQKASYMAFYEGRRPAGVVWNHKTGTKMTWKADGEFVPMTDEEQRVSEMRAASERLAAERERQNRIDLAAKRATEVYSATVPARADHSYLVAKRIKPDGLRQNAQGHLVVPMRTADGQLMNVQTIDAQGNKRFLPGGAKAGTFFVLGEGIEGKTAFVVEGVATGQTVLAASRTPVIVAFDAGNLMPVAQAVRARCSDMRLIFAADNDAHLPLRDSPRTRENVGMVKATAAAEATAGVVVLPPALQSRLAKDQGTDWNDYGAEHGMDAVRAALQAQMREAENTAPRQRV